jgi:hypothetical protein
MAATGARDVGLLHMHKPIGQNCTLTLHFRCISSKIEFGKSSPDNRGSDNQDWIVTYMCTIYYFGAFWLHTHQPR